MRQVAHNGIEALRHPKRAFAARQLVHRFCGQGFPGTQNFSQRVLPERLDQEVNVIWHHDEIIQRITFAVEAEERVDHNFRAAWRAQETTAVALIKPLLAIFFVKPNELAACFPIPGLGMKP